MVQGMHAATLARPDTVDGPFSDLRFVGGGTGQAPADGVGALLRYAD